MGEAIRHQMGIGQGSGPAEPRWFWHHQLKKPMFGRFMKTWRWPTDVPQQGWERIWIASKTGSRLSAIVKLSPVANVRAVVVCAHPMGLAAKGFWLRYGHAQALLDAGYHVVAYDYNGFGESPSTSFEYPLDAMAVGRWARARFPGLAVHALTASFGANNTLSAISRADFPYDSVVAEGCAPSLLQFWKAYPFAYAVLRTSFLLVPSQERKIHPVAHLPYARRGLPILLISSEADTWTPPAFADEIAAAAAPTTPVQRLRLDKAEHTHGMRDEPERYLPAVLDFFAAATPATAT